MMEVLQVASSHLHFANDHMHFSSVPLPITYQDSLGKNLIQIPSKKMIDTFQVLTWFKVETRFEDTTGQTNLIDGLSHLKKMILLSTVSVPLSPVFEVGFTPYMGDHVSEEPPRSAVQPFVDKTHFTFMLDCMREEQARNQGFFREGEFYWN